MADKNELYMDAYRAYKLAYSDKTAHDNDMQLEAGAFWTTVKKRTNANLLHLLCTSEGIETTVTNFSQGQ